MTRPVIVHKFERADGQRHMEQVYDYAATFHSFGSNYRELEDGAGNDKELEDGAGNDKELEDGAGNDSSAIVERLNGF